MMDESSSDAIAVPQIPLRAGESVRIVFDSRDGLIPASAPRGEAVVLTDQRVLRDGFADTGRVVTVFPLDELSAVEVASAGRSFERLGQGLMLLAAGLVLGGLSWIILEVLVLSVLLGGLPILGGVYSLTGWAFPDTDGALRLYARGHAIALPLRGNAAQATAHNAMQGIYELRWGSAAPSSESAAAPARESAIAPRESAIYRPFAPAPATFDQPQERHDESASAVDVEINRLVEEVDEEPPSTSSPEQPRPSIWDLFRRKS